VANLAGRFRGRPLRAGIPPGSRVVLVDDVVTSGATLTEAARALRNDIDTPFLRAGTPVLGADTPVLAAVVAATPRRPPRAVPAAPAGAFTLRR
jgi:hypothetical protein